MLKSTEMETINALVSKMSLEDVKMVSERLNMQLHSLVNKPFVH